VPLAGRPYVDMHGLFQIALALASGGGMAGVGLLRVAFVLATLALLWSSVRRRGVDSPALLGIGMGLALCAWELRFMARPELASTLCLAAQLWLLRRHADGGGSRWLWTTVPLQFLWALSHALSLLGIAVLGLYAVTSLRPAAGGRARGQAPARGPRREPWLVLAAASAVMFLNPYGVRGVAFLWELRTRIQSGNPFGESILELMSPFSPQAAGVLPLVAFKVLLFATALVVLGRLRHLSWFDLGLVALFGWLAATHVRNIGLFAVAALPVSLDAAAGLGRVLAARAAGPRAAGALATALVAVALLFVAEQAVAGGWYAANNRPMRFGCAESPAVFPIATTAALGASGLPGPLFNTLDLGGYLEMHRPGNRTFIDGRLEVIGEQFYREYSDVVSGDGWAPMVERYGVKVALVANVSHALIARIHADRDWAPIEADGAAVLFAHLVPANRATIAAAERFATQSATPGPGAAPIVPPREPPWPVSVLSPRRIAFEAWGRGNAFTLLGMHEAARREYARALLGSDRAEPAVVKAYVSANVQLGRLDEARAWCRKLIELSPADEQAQALLARLETR